MIQSTRKILAAFKVVADAAKNYLFYRIHAKIMKTFQRILKMRRLIAPLFLENKPIQTPLVPTWTTKATRTA